MSFLFLCRMYCTIKENECKANESKANESKANESKANESEANESSGERFLLIEHDRHNISVIEAKEGFIFDGRFKHAGARMNYRGTKEESMILRLEGLVRQELKKTVSDEQKFESIFNLMCNTERLDAVC